MAYGIRTIHLLKAPSHSIPLFLCPLLASCVSISHGPRRRCLRPRRHQLHVDTTITSLHSLPDPSHLLDLPRSCPGCGAFTQTVSPEQPGFYGTNRKSVKAFIDRKGQCPYQGHDGESVLFELVLGAADASLLAQMGLQEDGENRTRGQI